MDRGRCRLIVASITTLTTPIAWIALRSHCLPLLPRTTHSYGADRPGCADEPLPAFHRSPIVRTDSHPQRPKPSAPCPCLRSTRMLAEDKHLDGESCYRWKRGFGSLYCQDDAQPPLNDPRVWVGFCQCAHHTGLSLQSGRTLESRDRHPGLISNERDPSFARRLIVPMWI
jgi:hypothetical protein